MGDPPKRSPLDVPDLELGPPPVAKPSAAPTKSASAAPAPSSTLDYFGKGFDEDHFGGVSLGSGAPSGPAQPFMGEGVDFDDGGAPALLQLKSDAPPPLTGSLAPEARASNAPAGTPSNSYAPGNRIASIRAIAEPVEAVNHNQVAIAAIAGYGPVPQAIWETPLYAFRVFQRKRALSATLAELSRKSRAAEHTRDERLADIARGLRATLEADPRFAPSLAGVRQLESVAGSRGAELSDANTAFKQQANKLIADLAEVDKQLEERRAALKSVESMVSAANESFARVDARHKRSQIELRAAIQVSGAQPGVPVPVEHAEKIEGIQRIIAGIQPELNAKQVELAGAKERLGLVQREIQTLEREHDQIQSRRRTLHAHFEKQLDAQTRQLSSAEGDLTRALAEVARAALDGGVEIDPNTRAVVDAAEGELARVNESRDLHVAALDAFDHAAVQRGYVIVGALIGTFFLGILLTILL
jgi:hypothetical protein